LQFISQTDIGFHYFLEPSSAAWEIFMIKVAVCDDEQIYLNRIHDLLGSYIAHHEAEITTDLFNSSSKLLDRIENGERYDIYLLDIYMPGISGMSVAVELRSKGINSPIIFLTSSTEHAIEAFGVNATHYLLKPYTAENFFAAMEKAFMSVTDRTDESIVLKIGGEYRNISASDILYCEAADNHQRLYIKDGNELLVRMTASELYEILEKFGCFYRCGRAYILNFDYVKKVTATSAVLKDGSELSISRLASSGLRTAFFDYFK